MHYIIYKSSKTKTELAVPISLNLYKDIKKITLSPQLSGTCFSRYYRLSSSTKVTVPFKIYTSRTLESLSDEKKLYLILHNVACALVHLSPAVEKNIVHLRIKKGTYCFLSAGCRLNKGYCLAENNRASILYLSYKDVISVKVIAQMSIRRHRYYSSL